MRETPLTQEHVAAGAKLVDFAGWQMPLHYGSQIDEHHAVRRDAGAFDISHMLAIDVSGSGATPYLRRLLANNIDKLDAPGKALYSCILADDGGILDDLIVYRLLGNDYRVVVNAATAQRDWSWLTQHGTNDVYLRARTDVAMLAVQGPRARERFGAAFPDLHGRTQSLAPFNATIAGDWLIARTGYTGEDGYELMLPASQAVATWRRLIGVGMQACGLGARDTLRLEAGLNLYGQDMDATVTPYECGLGWTVEMRSARDFIGRAALIGRAPAWGFWGLVLEEHAGILRSHQQVLTGHGDGVITSGGFSPTMQASIALARMPLESRPGDKVRVAVRNKELVASVVKPPFVRNGAVLV
jgi:aminomethyltransferase